MGALVRVEEFIRLWRRVPESSDVLEHIEVDDQIESLLVPDLIATLRYARAAAVLHTVAMTHDRGRGGCECDLCATLRERGFDMRVDTV